MENFVVIDKATDKQVGAGFATKEAAKAKRDELQGKTKNGLPPANEASVGHMWTFKVSKGKDHPKRPNTVH